MKTLREDDLIFDVGSFLSAYKFDDDAIHGRKSSMKRADFILETDTHHIILEVKDPDNPHAVNRGQFISDLKSGNVISELSAQCRDTLLFMILSDKISKPVKFIALICFSRIDKALLLSRIDDLKNKLPIKNCLWAHDCVESCAIITMETYKSIFGDGAIWRHSDYEN